MTVVSYLLGQRRFPVPYDLRQMTLLTVMVALIAFAAYFVLGGMWWAQVLLMLGFVMFFLWREQAALKHLLKR
jgi:hypothetical protein